MIKYAKVKKKCVICGEEFYVYNTTIGKYCSKKCKEVVLFNYRNGTNFKTLEELDAYKKSGDYRGRIPAKPVMQFRLDGTYIRTIPSVHTCDLLGDEDGSFKRNSVARCARGERNTYRDYFWIYKEDYSPEEIQRRISLLKNRHKEKKKPVIMLDMDGNYIARYESVTDGAANMYVAKQNLVAHLQKKERHGTCVWYLWMYEQDYLERMTN